MIKPPFNYTGNKNRLVKKIVSDFFPEDESTNFLDMFGGGSTVAINAPFNRVTYNDKLLWITSIIKILQREKIQKVLSHFDQLVYSYKFTCSYHNGLEKYKHHRQGNNGLKFLNLKPFLALRGDINEKLKSKKFNQHLWLDILFLSFYSFNNDIRFNNKNLINIPVGKTDYNRQCYERLIKFSQALKIKKIQVKTIDFRKMDLSVFDFVYADPPYIKTTAVYNSTWGLKDNEALFEILENYSKKGGKFALSNLSLIKGEKNEPLLYWVKKNKFKMTNISYSYRTSSYNKNRFLGDQEVVITNA